MGSALSRINRGKAASALVAVLLAAVVILVSRRFGDGGDGGKGRRLTSRKTDTEDSATSDTRADAPTASSSTVAMVQKSTVQGRDRKEKPQKGGPLKGVVPQKIDVFAEAVTAEFPSTVSEAEARRRFPRKYELHGHVVVVRMNTGVTVDEFRPLAEAFAQSFAPIVVDVVLLDRDGIVGELRRPKLDVLFSKPRAEMEHLAYCPRIITKRWKESRAKGLATSVPQDELTNLIKDFTQSETYTVHIENGVRYGFDVNKVMFCSGNTTERMHFASLNASGETVVDMFVGIGYFTLPLAMHGGVKAIHALDKNPDSVAFVRLNAVQNRVDHLVYAQCGDNRVIGSELAGKCDRVLMGLIPTCKEFLPRAIFFLKKNENGRAVGTVHYHFLADKPVARKVAVEDVQSELGEEAVKHMTIKELRCVKSYAPKRYHYVADLVFE